MIFLDCERLKVPDTGLYYFCGNLTSALLRVAEKENMKMTVFLRKKNAGFFGNHCQYLTYRSLYKYAFPYWHLRNGIWHSMFQYPAIMPRHAKTVLTIHDLNYLYEDMQEEQRRMLHDSLQKAVDKASLIASISEYTRKDILSHLNVGDRPVHIIYNGCNRYTGETKEPDFKPSGKFIYSIGAILPKKNFHTLPCLLQDNEMELVISGPMSSYADLIMQEASSCGVADRVHLTGPVSEECKHWYLQHCTAFAFPSIAEGFGLPALEAMYYGKPVFLSKHTSLPEVGGDRAFYFNFDFDRRLMKEEFKKGMDDFMSGKISPESITERACKFSWDKAASQYIELYKELQTKTNCNE